jgi:uncharacterized protein (DUF433 family)
MVNYSEPFFLDESHRVDQDPRATVVGEHPQFSTFAAALICELAPQSGLEHVLADRVILSAWTLQLVGEKELVAIGNPFPGNPCDEALTHRRIRLAGVDVSPQGISLVVQGLAQALAALQSLRTQAPLPAGPRGQVHPAADVTAELEIEGDLDAGPDSVFDFDHELDDEHLADLSNEWPVVPRGRSVEDTPILDAEAEHERGDDDRKSTIPAESPMARRWSDRLMFDPSVSEDSPVIKGTWVTVAQVVSLIVEGWTWTDILRTHPEINEEDIRVCLAYTVAQENGEL